MYCINCGKELPDDAKFCPGCGNKIGSKPKADVKMPDFKNYAVKVDFPGSIECEDKRQLGHFVRDIVKCNEDKKNFRIKMRLLLR